MCVNVAMVSRVPESVRLVHLENPTVGHAYLNSWDTIAADLLLRVNTDQPV